MFEKATLFSAIIVFIAFGIVGIKMFSFYTAEDKTTKTSMNQEQLLINYFS